MTRIISGWLAAAVLCLATSHAAAIGPSEVIASTFGPGDSYNGNAAFYIQYFPPDVSSPTGYQLAHAVRFQPSLADYVLETTRLSIFRRFNSGDLPRVTISAADAGGGPGAALASKTIGGFVPVDTPFQSETAPPVAIDWTAEHVLLHGGSSYWLSLHYPAPSGQEVFWSVSSPVALGALAARGHSYGDPNMWNVFIGASMPAFSVIATRVPEPGALALASAAAACVALARQRRRVAMGASAPGTGAI